MWGFEFKLQCHQKKRKVTEWQSPLQLLGWFQTKLNSHVLQIPKGCACWKPPSSTHSDSTFPSPSTDLQLYSAVPFWDSEQSSLSLSFWINFRKWEIRDLYVQLGFLSETSNLATVPTVHFTRDNSWVLWAPNTSSHAAHCCFLFAESAPCWVFSGSWFL
jgi:hypothetical protein